MIIKKFIFALFSMSLFPILAMEEPKPDTRITPSHHETIKARVIAAVKNCDCEELELLLATCVAKNDQTILVPALLATPTGLYKLPIISAKNLFLSRAPIDKLLIEHGVNVNGTNPRGKTALMKAANYCDEPAIVQLLQSGADVHLQTNHQRRDALSYAAGRYNNEKICALLIAHGAEINAEDLSNTSPLVYAALTGSESVCKVLIENGAHVNTDGNSGYGTPLHAVFISPYPNIQLANLLIEANTDINDQFWKSRRCTFSVENPHALRFLLDAGIDLKSLSKEAYLGVVSPLARCASTGTSADKRKNHILITCSRFFPLLTPKELKESQRRTRARLSVFKIACPQLPRVLQELILSFDVDMWQDACNTPLFMHTKKHTRVTQMPLSVLKILMQHNALDEENTVELLTKYKIANLKPHMIEAKEEAHTFIPENNEWQILMDHALLEENYGIDIKNHIRDCLKTDNTHLLSNCSIQ